MRRLFRGRSSRRDKKQLVSRLTEAILVLEKRRRLLLGMMSKLEERRESLRSKIISAKNRNEKERLAIYVTEYKELEKLVRLLRTAELSLQKATLRLDSVKYYIMISGEVSAAIGTVRSVSDILQEMPGSLSRVTDDIMDTLSWLNGELTLTSDGRIDVSAMLEGKMDIQTIIDEAVEEVAGGILRGVSEPYEQEETREEANSIIAAAKNLAADKELVEIVTAAAKRKLREEEEEGLLA